MCTKLSNNVQEERSRWVLPIIEKKTKLKDLAKIFYGGKRTLERWVSDYKKYEKEGLISKSTRPKSHPNETPIREKESIIEMRNKTKSSDPFDPKLHALDIECQKLNIIHYLKLNTHKRVFFLARSPGETVFGRGWLIIKNNLDINSSFV